MARGQRRRRRRRRRLRPDRAGLRRLCSVTPPDGARSTNWDDRHPDRQRQQQLFDRLHRAVPPARPFAAELSNCVQRSARREDAASSLERRHKRTESPLGQLYQGIRPEIGKVRLSSGTVDVPAAASREYMRQCSAAPGAVRQDRLQRNHKRSVNNPYAQFQVRITAGGHHGEGQDDRSADQATVLADLGRLGRRKCWPREVRRLPRPRRRAVERSSPGDDHRLRLDVRQVGEEHHRPRHECSSGTQGLRPERGWAGGTSRSSNCDCFSANELLC